MLAAPARTGRLTLAYMTVAVAAFVTAALAVPWLAPELAGHHYHPRLLALTHMVTLGWITLTIMGASYQLVPVLLEQPLWSERLAWGQLGLATAGTLGMVAHFFIGEWSGVAWASALVALAVLAHVVNVGMSVRHLPRWTVTAVTIVFALGGLAMTTLAGLALGLDHLRSFLPWPFLPRLHAHFHLAVLGWVLPMVIGVAARVYPVFFLAPAPGARLAAAQLGGLAVGVPLVVVGVLEQHPWLVSVGAVGGSVAVVGHLSSVVGMVRARRRPRLDGGLLCVLTGAAFLLPAWLLGLALAAGVTGGPRPALAYATLVLGGWVSLTITGMMLKIVPFLVWYRVYASRAGREPVPTVAQLSSPTRERVTCVLLTLGMGGLSVALFVGDALGIRAAGLAVAGGGLALALTLARVVHHVLPSRVGRVPAAAAGVSP